jgi:hypothetical protein
MELFFSSHIFKILSQSIDIIGFGSDELVTELTLFWNSRYGHGTTVNELNDLILSRT